MNNISLNIVANAQFQQVYAEVAKLKEAMMTLQKVSVGSPFTADVTANIKSAQSAFDQAVMSTRAFTIQHVAMTDSVTKFGQQLAAGKLSLSQYYNIWRSSAKGVSQELDNLATSQARLNRSIAVADPLRPGYAKLVTDINGVVTAEEKAIFYQKALNTALHDGAMKMIDFGKNTQWMGRQLTVGLTMPLAMFGAAASSAYLKFDQQMTSMLKVYGAHAVVQSQQTLDAIEKDVTALADKMARTLGVAMSDTVEIAKTFSSIGLEGQNLISATEATVKLQKLGDLTAQNAANSMVSLQNVFKLQANQVASAVDFLNAAKHSTSTTMQDIVDALPRVGPIIQQMGGTYKDFVSFLVALKESGVPAAQGANAIKSMLASMINPTAAAQKALSAMHINIKQIVAENQGNVMGMVQGLQKALDALPASDRLKAIEQTFGKFQFARVTALLNNLGAAGSQSAKVLELYGQTNDQLAKVSAQELKTASQGTPAAQFQKMKATLQADLIPLGRTFLESFTKLGNVLDKVMSFFKTIAKDLGPLAGILGKVFGAGLVGAVIIGPILMLTGLFANLIGNLLKGANYMRMFKQGMDEAGPSQNKFTAGLQNMRNFYENLDLGMVAARNQMDLMPEAITSNAKAFEVLSKAILDLTSQFEALAVAQREAMITAPMGAAVHMPGFASGFVGLPGSGSEDTIPAMLAPGESIITAKATAKYAPILHAMNNGNLRGFRRGITGLTEEQLAALGPKPVRPTGAYEGSLAYTLEKDYYGPFGFRGQGGYAEMKPTSGSYASGTGEFSALNEQMKRGRAQAGMFINAMKEFTGESTEASKMFRTSVTDYLDVVKTMTDSTGKAAITQENVDKILAEINTQYEKALLAMEEQGVLLSDTNGPLAEIANKVMMENASLSSNPAAFQRMWQRFNVSSSNIASPTFVPNAAGTAWSLGSGPGGSRAIRIGDPEFGNATVGELKGAEKDTLFYHSYNEKFIQYVNSVVAEIKAQAESAGVKLTDAAILGLTEGIANAAQIHSPSEVTYVQGEMFVEGGLEGIKSKLPEAEVVGASIAESVMVGAEQLMLPGMAGAGGGTTFLGMPGLRPGITSTQTEEVAANASRWSKFKTFAAGKPGSMMNPTAMAAMMLPMMTNMIPNNVAGSGASDYVGAGKNMLMTGGMTYGMMSMIGPLAGIAAPVAGAIVAFQGLSFAVKKIQEDIRMSGNLMKSTFSISSEAAQAFKLQTDNIANIDVSTAMTKINNHADAIQKNKQAIDELTMAYKNATDQQTKDTISQLKGMSQSDLNQWASQHFGTVFSAGATVEQARQDVISLMKAADKNNLAISYALSALPKYSDSSTKSPAQGYKATFSSIYGINNIGNQFDYQSLFEGKFSKADQDFAQYIAGLSTNSPSSLKSVTDSLKGYDKEVINSKQTQGLFIDNITKQNDQLGTLYSKLKDAGVSTLDMMKATSLLNAGLGVTADNIQSVITNAQELNRLFTLGSAMSALQQYDVANPPSAGPSAADTKTLTDNKTLIDQNKVLIKQLQDEKTLRDQLYNAQMRNIDAQQKQASLEADIINARGSGDLLKLAVAQQNYQIQKTKDAMQAAKDNADNATDSKIKALEDQNTKLQNSIDTINAKGTGTTTTTTAKTPAQKAEDWIQTAKDNINTFIQGLGDTYKTLLQAGLDPKTVQGIIAAEVQGMDWKTFDTNLMTIYNALAKTFGDKAAAAIVIDTITIDLQSIIDAAITGGKLKGVSTADIQKLVDTVKAVILKVETGDDPATKKQVAAAYATFASDLMDAVKKPMTAAQFFNIVQDEFKKLALAVYSADIHSKDPKVRAKAQADYDYIISQGTSFINGVYKVDPAQVTKHRNAFVAMWDGIVNTLSGILSGIFNGIQSAATAVFTLGGLLTQNIPASPPPGSKVPTPTPGPAPTPTKTVAPTPTKTVAPTPTNTVAQKTLVPGTGQYVGSMFVPAQYKAKGGIIHAATGMLIGAGTSTSDSIPAMLSNGEYVIKADSVSKYGKPFMDAINNKTYSVPSSSLTPSRDISDAIANSTNIGGHTINVYAPEGADATAVANLVINKLDQQAARQRTMRKVK